MNTHKYIENVDFTKINKGTEHWMDKEKRERETTLLMDKFREYPWCSMCGDGINATDPWCEKCKRVLLKEKQDESTKDTREASFVESYVESFEKTETGGCKDSKGKQRLDLVPVEMEDALAEALEAGVKKGYEERNWELGLPLHSISITAARRHINKWRKGIDIDEETGVHHLKLAFLNLGMAVTQVMRGRNELDDRVKEEKK